MHTKEYSPELIRQIKAKIEEIKAIAEELPGIIIIHHNRDMSVAYMSSGGTNFLGLSLEELIAMGPVYHEHFFNPEESRIYVPKIISLLQRNNPLEWISYFQQVRSSPDKDWTWFSSSSKILLRDEQGQPILNITIALPIDVNHYNTIKVDRLQKENSFLRQNYSKFAALSMREREILKLTVLGKSANEIAEELFISAATVDTHRKNLKKKLEANTSYDLAQYALAFDLI